jgi:F0F1-type ATP synthase assembly protein I
MPPNKTNKNGSALGYVGLAIQMVATILAAMWAGNWLDERMQNERPWFMLGAGIIVTIGILIQLVRKLSS